MIKSIFLFLFVGVISGCSSFYLSLESPYREALYLSDQGYNEAAYELFLLAAERGHVRSKFHVGQMLVRGLGVAENCDLGVEWLERASDRGDSSASFVLSLLYRPSSTHCELDEPEKSKIYLDKSRRQAANNKQ